LTSSLTTRAPTSESIAQPVFPLWVPRFATCRGGELFCTHCGDQVTHPLSMCTLLVQLILSFVKMTNSLSEVKVTGASFLDSFSIRSLGRLCAALFTILLVSIFLALHDNHQHCVNEMEYESGFSLWKFHHRTRLRPRKISTAANSHDFAFLDAVVNFVTAVTPRTLNGNKLSIVCSLFLIL